MTREELIDFENEIASCFDDAQIRAPVHLYNGNEEQMLEVFKKHNIGSDDWVFGSWRSHYQCLLKGVPPKELKEAILKGRSISLCFAKQKVFCSGIVTGVIPIAVGTAWGTEELTYEGINDEYITYYRYDASKWPHAGAGKRVQF